MPTVHPEVLDSLKQRYYAKQAMIDRLQEEQLDIIAIVYEMANPEPELEND